MEDVPDLYEEPCDPMRPVICFDEKPYQLIGETRVPISREVGKPLRYDCEYERNGTANIFMTVEPAAGKRDIVVTEQRTKQDFAEMMRHIADDLCPNADKIRIVTDNLNTHKPAAPYERFEAEEARRILRRLEFHYTPKHAGWLSMAETEISVLSGQCIGRRIGDAETLRREISAWQEERNKKSAKTEWRFTNTKARGELGRLYPSESLI